MQPLRALTRLADLRIGFCDGEGITAELLSGLSLLTCLQLRSGVELDILAGKTLLQHLDLGGCSVAGGAAGAAQLLCELQLLQQLTCLQLAGTLAAVEDGVPHAAAYSALTASSKLQRLDISSNTLPAGAWQHVFPAGRRLPHLETLLISGAKLPSGDPAAAPDFSRVVSCCPGLRNLCMHSLQYEEEQLEPLRQLRGLRTLTDLWSCIWEDP